jgi:hypothetical protein
MIHASFFVFVTGIRLSWQFAWNYEWNSFRRAFSLVDFFWHWHQKTFRQERVCLWPNLHHQARWPTKEEWICPHGLLVVAAGHLCQKNSWTMETRSWPYFDPDYERNGTRNNPPRSVTHPNSVLYGSGVAITCFRHFLHHTLTWSTHPQYAVARCLYFFREWQLCHSLSWVWMEISQFLWEFFFGEWSFWLPCCSFCRVVIDNDAYDDATLVKVE